MKELARERVVRLVLTAIERGNYDIIRRALDIAYDNSIECVTDDNWIAIEDEIFYFNGAF